MHFIDAHTHSFSADPRVISIRNHFPDETFRDGFFSIGLHPWKIDPETLEEQLLQIKQQLSHPNCLALGECGLDKKIKVPIELQKRAFEAQLKLAAEFEKPVIIHCVAAFQEIMVIKKALDSKIPMLIHGFAKKIPLAEQLINAGFYLSFGAALIENVHVQQTFRSLSADRVFLETDSSKIPIQSIYESAAKIKGIEIDALQMQMADNFSQIFGMRGGEPNRNS